MKNRLFVFSILFLCISLQVFVCSETCTAQLPPISNPGLPMYSNPSVEDLSVKRPYVSIDLYYSISLPEPTYSNNWIFKEGRVGINVNNAQIVGGKQNFKDFTQTNNSNLISKLQGKITDEKYYDGDNTYSSITFFAFDNGKFAIRKFAVSANRLYIMFAEFEKSDNGEFFENTFKTFKIVSELEVKSEIQRKLIEATPQDLPQKPILKDQQPDAKDENLRGKVSKIVDESETITDDVGKKNKRISQTREFDKDGCLTKVVQIDYRGNPDSVEVYGFIDGKRVSKAGYVKYSYNPPAPKATPSKIQPEPKRDLRYTTSYEKKYRNGKLIEKTFYGNNGTMWLRQVSNYTDNQLEFLVYSSDGKLNQKYVSTIDKKGLVVEETRIDVLSQKPSADTKYKYEYVLDKSGNWTTKILSKQVTEDGKTFFKPLYIYYRTITYYE
jgi:hypothetical protein